MRPAGRTALSAELSEDAPPTYAKAAAQTASEKRKSAEESRDDAQAQRDDAWDAEQKANAAGAKSDATSSVDSCRQSDLAARLRGQKGPWSVPR